MPIALSTDDPGVSRIDITDEYVKATITYHLGYRDLKDLARTSLEYAFLPGRSLWQSRTTFRPVAECAGTRPGSARPTPACRKLLEQNPKAALQWQQEASFSAYEAGVVRQMR